MKLDYIMIYRDTGTPIYTNYFSGFCANLGVDHSLLFGFLSAITTMPEMFGEGEQLHAVELGSAKLHFD